MTTKPDCVFCAIIARNAPANIHYEDDALVVFDNQLDWAPVMLLVAPRAHMTQAQLWSSGALLGRLGKIAEQFGKERCPDGFRILSNFGEHGMQSQAHAHLHVVGGRRLGPYVWI